MSKGAQMKTRLFAVSLLAAGLAVFSPAYANVQSFFTPAGSTDTAGEPVSASATFTTSTDQIVLVLTNLQTGIKSAGQLLSDIFFTAGGATAGAGNITPATSYINIASGGGVTADNTFTRSWKFDNTAGTYHLNGLANGSNTPAGLIIGPGPYTSANSSIAGNGPHNPFADQTATFTFALGAGSGVDAATSIANVVFSFGTEAGDNIPVPIPAAVWLFGSGLLGLIGIARRRHAGIAMSAPLAA
jgi:hypothetical protein